MNIENFVAIPEALHDKARAAIIGAFDGASVAVVGLLLGGASGAHAFRLAARGRDYVLRIEGTRNPLRNPHQYTCMRIAAEAGIAPPLRYVDEQAGVVIIDFISHQPLTVYPGGPVALADALGLFVRDLHATAPFPVLGDYRSGIERILGFVKTSFAAGLLDPYLEGLDRIRTVYPWDAAQHVSSHNDPNLRNILFDGKRLWLVDWETSYRNDRFIDVAVLAENVANTPELETALLRSWSGTAPTATMQAQLMLARLLTKLYYAGLLSLLAAPKHAPVQDLTAPTPDEFGALVAAGKLSPGDSATLLMLARMLLAGFRTAMDSAAVRAAIATFA